jgi:hypothetical protein
MHAGGDGKWGTKNEKKQHHEGNMALRIISILTR